jgi:hypothetical protein
MTSVAGAPSLCVPRGVLFVSEGDRRDRLRLATRLASACAMGSRELRPCRCSGDAVCAPRSTFKNGCFASTPLGAPTLCSHKIAQTNAQIDLDLQGCTRQLQARDCDHGTPPWSLDHEAWTHGMDAWHDHEACHVFVCVWEGVFMCVAVHVCACVCVSGILLAGGTLAARVDDPLAREVKDLDKVSLW